MMGQIPPPWHGQAVATKLLFDHAWEGFDVYRLEMQFSRRMDEVGRFRMQKITHLFSLIRIARRILKDNPDTILFYPPGSANWTPFIRDVLFLCTVRHLARHTVFIHHASGLADFCNKGLLRRLLGRISYGESRMSLEVAEESYPPHLHFRARAWRWCPCGIEIPSDMPERTRQPGDPFHCLFVGSLQEGKGVLEILRTAKLLKDQGLGSKFHFQIVGKWFSSDFKNTALDLHEELALTDMVEFSGELTGQDKWNAYAAADAFVFPTHYQSEATPIVLMEALGFGLPVIATQWAGIPKMMEGCTAATLLPIKSPDAYAKALKTLAEGPSNGDALSRAAKSHYSKHFTPESFINRVESAFTDSISSSSN